MLRWAANRVGEAEQRGDSGGSVLGRARSSEFAYDGYLWALLLLLRRRVPIGVNLLSSLRRVVPILLHTSR